MPSVVKHRRSKHQANQQPYKKMPGAKTNYNLTKAKEIKNKAIEDYRELARKTKDPAVRDYANFMIRDTDTASKIHIARLKFRTR